MADALTSGQLNALQAVVSAAEQIAATVSIELDQARALLTKLETFLVANHTLLAPIEFSLQLDTAATSASTSALNAISIRSAVGAQQPILTINQDGDVIGQSSGSIDFSKTSARTAKSRGFELRYGGGAGYFFLDGRIVDEQDFSRTGQKLVVGPSRRRPYSELAVLLADHHTHALKNEAQCRYWGDKKKRVLLCVPDKTETIFQRSLFSWLKLNTSDAISVFAEPSGLGQEKTDINVVTVAGKHVIEIKWLGKNTKRTGFANPPRLDEGLRQVALYLQSDQELITGDLVVYDGREPGADCSYTMSDKHALCREPRIVFLESLSPSVLAEEPAKGKKKSKAATKKPKKGGTKKKQTTTAATTSGPTPSKPSAKLAKTKTPGTSP